MKKNAVYIDKYTFKFEDIDLIYPVYLKCKDKEEYYNFRRSVVNGIRSRTYQLNHRSTQAIIFDKLIELDYFKLLGINYNFITEIVLINTRPDIDLTRSYYLLDYFIPDLSLCIELDSDYHNPVRDKLKDQFLSSIGIDVYRIYDFQSDTKDKLNRLVEYIKEKKEVKFELSYESLIEECKYYLDNKDRLEYEKRLKENPLIVLSNKWRPIIEKLDKTLIPGILKCIISGTPCQFEVKFSELHNVYPLKVKEMRNYLPLISYLKRFNISLSITNGKNRYEIL